MISSYGEWLVIVDDVERRMLAVISDAIFADWIIHISYILGHCHEGYWDFVVVACCEVLGKCCGGSIRVRKSPDFGSEWVGRGRNRATSSNGGVLSGLKSLVVPFRYEK